MASQLYPPPNSAAAADTILLPARRFSPLRYHAGGLSAWSGHLPFAYDLVAALRPSVLVELGTHYGESYFGFCQAVDENRVDCRCYAVDTWKGDPHAGFYGDNVFQDVREYNRAHYAAFSTLLRCTFDQANPQFSDASIDLLHIDGLHTYAAVKRDFELWLPRVRPGGIVLLHDINVRHGDFEVWRLWEELRDEYEHFEFHHSWGLGVLRVPDSAPPPPGLLSILFLGSEEDRHAVREHYSFAADYLELSRGAAQAASQETPKQFVQVFGDRAGLWMESASVRADIRPGQWQTVCAELTQGADTGQLRIDVAEYPCIAEIASVAARRSGDNTLLFEYTTVGEIEACASAGDLMPLPAAGTARFLSFGCDPQLLVRAPESVRLDAPLMVEIRMRIVPGLEGAAPAREPLPPAADLAPELEWKLSLARVESLRAEVLQHQAERAALIADLQRARAERDAFAHDRELRARLEEEAAVLRTDLARRDSELTALHAEMRHLQSRVGSLDQELLRLQPLEAKSARLRSRVVRLIDSRRQLKQSLRAGEAEAEQLRTSHAEERQELQEHRHAADEEAARLRIELTHLHRFGAAESARLRDELTQLRRSAEKEADELPARLAEMRRSLAAECADLRTQLADEKSRFEAALRNSAQQLQAKDAEITQLRKAVSALQAHRDDLLQSLSWRGTKPLRALYSKLRPVKPA